MSKDRLEGNVLPSALHQVFENYGGNQNYKNNKVNDYFYVPGGYN